MERFIDVAAFSKSLTFYIGMFHSLTACQINYI